jgi:hypothetical protein
MQPLVKTVVYIEIRARLVVVYAIYDEININVEYMPYSIRSGAHSLQNSSEVLNNVHCSELRVYMTESQKVHGPIGDK